MKVKLSSLLGKEVNTLSGLRLGTLVNVELEAESGNLASLLVEPRTDATDKHKVLDSSGRMRLPFASIRSVKDVVMVDYDLDAGAQTHEIA